MNITNDAQLKAAILKELSVALDKAATKIHDQLWDDILSKIYSTPESEFYERTKEFLNSVIKPKVKINGFRVEVTVGMDSSAMTSKEDESHFFNKHMDIFGNSEWKRENDIKIPEALLTWWDEGTKGKSIHKIIGTDYWFDVMGDRGCKDNPDYQKAIDVIDKIVDEELSKIGVVQRI